MGEDVDRFVVEEHQGVETVPDVICFTDVTADDEIVVLLPVWQVVIGDQISVWFGTCTDASGAFGLHVYAFDLSIFLLFDLRVGSRGCGCGC